MKNLKLLKTDTEIYEVFYRNTFFDVYANLQNNSEENTIHSEDLYEYIKKYKNNDFQLYEYIIERINTHLHSNSMLVGDYMNI